MIGYSGSVPGLKRSSGEGNGNPLQYSCLENSMDRGSWGATDHGVSQSQTLPEQLSRSRRLSFLLQLLLPDSSCLFP